MIRLRCVVPFALSLAMTSFAAEEKGTLKSRDFSGFLYRGSDGHVWYGDTISTLGMWGTMANLPQYRLSPTLARRFKPLVNDIGDLSDGRRIFTPQEYLTGRSKLSETPKVYVSFQGRYREAPVNVKRQTMEASGEAHVFEHRVHTYEISSAQLVWVEAYSPGWLAAWRRLDESLREIVAASLTAPGPAKRERITKAMDKGAATLGALATRYDDKKMVAVIRDIEPRARLVNVGKCGRWPVYRDWRKLLEQCSERLNVPLRPSPPPWPDEFPAKEMLLKADSPEAFLAEVRRSRPDAMEEIVAFSDRLGRRLLRVWEIEYLTDAEFKTLVEEIREREAKAKKAREQYGATWAAESKPPPRHVTIEEQGISVGIVGKDLMSQKLIPGGVLVEKVLPDSKSGLRAGDVILTYETTYDLTMTGGSTPQAVAQFAAIARDWPRAKLNVLRGDELIEVVITNQK